MTPEEFQNKIQAHDLSSPVAVAVSGGSDSMALAYALTQWTELDVHVLSVDHGLRPDSANEVAMVAGLAKEWGTRFQALQWEHDGIGASVQEEARNARYDLMSSYCLGHGIRALFLGHHMDDQAETVLFRLAKGSGLDGLTGMREVQEHGSGVTIMRPFLYTPKEELVGLCARYSVPFIHDPSNENEAYARVRLRRAREVLEAEGLSAKRLAVTAKRLEKAREALEYYVGEVYNQALVKMDPGRIVFNFKVFKNAPEEIGIRCLLKAFKHFRGEGHYSPRMEKVESLYVDLMGEVEFRKRTLGGVIFSRDDKDGCLVFEKE